MAFDTKKFLKTKFAPREESIPVPDLKEFFGEGEKPAWKVRGLTGQELGRANEAAARNKNISAILEGLASAQGKEMGESIRKLVNAGNETPQDIAKRIELFMIGSVEPKADLDLALHFCTAFPIEFFQITNKILELTGKGHVPGKPKGSGATTKSEPH